MKLWKKRPNRTIVSVVVAGILGFTGVAGGAAAVAAQNDLSQRGGGRTLDDDSGARAIEGAVSASLKLTSTTTEGVYPDPSFGEVPVNGGGGQYQLKVSSVATGATNSSIEIPLEPGFYWDKAEIDKLSVSSPTWAYSLQVSWEGCITTPDETELCSKLILTFPRVDEGANLYFQLPFSTVQTNGEQSGDVMAAPVVSIKDGNGTHAVTADKGVTVVSVPRAQLLKTVSSAGGDTKQVQFPDGEKLATAFVSTISVGGVATEVGGRAPSLVQPLVVEDAWSINPAGTEVVHELDCVTYAAGEGCVAPPDGASVSLNLDSGNGTVTFDGFNQLPAADAPVDEDGNKVTSARILHWVPVELEHEMVPETTTFTNTATSTGWTDKLDGIVLSELTASDSATKNPWVEPSTDTTYSEGAWRKGSQEFINQNVDPVIIPKNIVSFYYPAGIAMHDCTWGNLRTTFNLHTNGYADYQNPFWTADQGCFPIWSPESKFVSTLVYSAPVAKKDGQAQRFAVPEHPILFDFWDPNQQQIVPEADIWSSVGVQWNPIGALNNYPTANIVDDAALFDVQYGTGAKCNQPEDNGTMADPQSALSWFDSIESAGGEDNVCGVRVQFLGGKEFMELSGPTIDYSQITNARNGAFAVSIPFTLVSQPGTDGAFSVDVHDYMAGTDGDGNPLIYGGKPEALKSAPNGTNGAKSYIRAGDYYLANSAPETSGEINKSLGYGGDVSKYRFTPDLKQYPGYDDEYETSEAVFTVDVPGPVFGVTPEDPEGWYSVVTENNDEGYTITWRQTEPLTVLANNFADNGVSNAQSLPAFNFDVYYSFWSQDTEITSTISDGDRTGYAGTSATASIPVEIVQPDEFVLAKSAGGTGEIKPGDEMSWMLSWYNGAEERFGVALEDILPVANDGRGSTTGAKLESWDLTGDGTVYYSTSDAGPWIELPSDPGELEAIDNVYAIQIRIDHLDKDSLGSLTLHMTPESAEYGTKMVNNMYDAYDEQETTRDVAVVIARTLVVPKEPTLVKATECGKAATVEAPDQEGVTFTQAQDGDKVTVTATPDDGYQFPEGAKTEWAFDVSAEECPEYLTPKAPTQKEVDCQDEPTVTNPTMTGVVYTQTRQGNIVTVTATPEEGKLFAPGVETVWVFDVTPAPCEVTPNAPTLTDVDCGETPELQLPEIKGVDYAEEWNTAGTSVTVTATAQDGYVFPQGAQTVWTLEVAAQACEVTPETPTMEPVACGETPKVDIPEGVAGVDYKSAQDGNQVTVTATAKDGYVFADNVQTVWVFDVTVKQCPPEITELEPVAPLLMPSTRCDIEPMVIIPTSDLVVYEQSREGDTVTVTAKPASELVVFPEGAMTEWTFDVAAKPCKPGPVEVTPEAPTVTPAASCGKDGTLNIPVVKGVDYTEAWDGTTVIVTATAAEGYVLTDGVQTSWTFNVAGEECLYTVTFDVNGGEGQADFPAITVVAGDSIKIYSKMPTREGHTFQGWLPQLQTRDASLIEAGATYKPSGDTVMIAQWVPISTEPTEPPTGPGQSGSTSGPAGSHGTGTGGAANGLASTGASMLQALLGVGALVVIGATLVVRRGRTHK